MYLTKSHPQLNARGINKLSNALCAGSKLRSTFMATKNLRIAFIPFSKSIIEDILIMFFVLLGEYTHLNLYKKYVDIASIGSENNNYRNKTNGPM